jgi:hypothetical protein
VILAALALARAGQPGSPSADGPIVSVPDLVLDANTAPPGVLETLPHVGATLVRQLVAAREIHPFTSLNDAGSRVRGLGPATRARIAPFLRFEGSTRRQTVLENSPDERPAAAPRPIARKPKRLPKQKPMPVQSRLLVSTAEPRAS